MYGDLIPTRLQMLQAAVEVANRVTMVVEMGGGKAAFEQMRDEWVGRTKMLKHAQQVVCANKIWQDAMGFIVRRNAAAGRNTPPQPKN